jgi:hypothetical protein
MALKLVFNPASGKFDYIDPALVYVAGTGITIDSTNPLAPVINSTAIANSNNLNLFFSPAGGLM